MSWKWEDNQEDLQEDHQAGDHEVSSRDFQLVAKNHELDLLEGSTPSETEKGTTGRAGAGNVVALAPNARERKKVE
jgi:hypothetical protein